MRDELYKKELCEQIEKKLEIERESKAKAEEADRKLEEKLRKDDERNLNENLKREETLKLQQVLIADSFKCASYVIFLV